VADPGLALDLVVVSPKDEAAQEEVLLEPLKRKKV
jgi:hypothetical protein